MNTSYAFALMNPERLHTLNSRHCDLKTLSLCSEKLTSVSQASQAPEAKGVLRTVTLPRNRAALARSRVVSSPQRKSRLSHFPPRSRVRWAGAARGGPLPSVATEEFSLAPVVSMGRHGKWQKHLWLTRARFMRRLILSRSFRIKLPFKPL